MQYTYLSSMLTTFEKIFGIKAQQTAYLMSGNEIAQVLFLFFLPLTMKVKKRPLWCSIGMVITSLGLYMMSLPHFISDHHLLLDTAPIPAEADNDFRHNISFAWSNEAPDTEQSQVSDPTLVEISEIRYPSIDTLFRIFRTCFYFLNILKSVQG